MMRATSKAARPLNTDAQREAILRLFAENPWQPSRQAVSEQTGIPEKTMTWRIREFLDAGTLRELEAVDGKHPLELIEQNSPCGLGIPQSQASKRPEPVGSVQAKAESDLVSTAQGSNVVAINPFRFARDSISLESARRIKDDKANYFYLEACAVIANGGAFRIWA